MKTNSVKSESGYTLVETLVAMSIFVLVLLVFMSMFVKVLFNERIELHKRAFIICQSNMVLLPEEENYQERYIAAGNMVIHKKFTKDARLVTLNVSVKLIENQKELVMLSKSFLVGK